MALVMGDLFLWSLNLCCLDLHSLMMGRNMQYSRVLLIIICIGDWVMTIVSLGAACASA
nr:CASP-like protein 5B2 [Ipomoea batatas]